MKNNNQIAPTSSPAEVEQVVKNAKKTKKTKQENELKTKYKQTNHKAKDFKGSLLGIIKMLKPFKWLVIIGLVFAVIGTVLSMIGPNILNQMMKALVPLDMHKVTTLGLILVAMYLTGCILSYFQGFILGGVAAKISRNLRTQITKKINRMPLNYFDTNSYGDVMSRLTNDVDTVGRTLDNTLSNLITSITMIIAIPIIMFTLSWQLTLIALCEIPLAFFVVSVIVKFNQKYFIKQQKCLGEMNGHIEEIYSAHNVVKAFNGEEKAFKEFEVINKELKRSGRKAQFYSGLMHPVINFIGNLVYICICLMGAYIAIKTNDFLFITSIITFMTYIKLFNQPLSQLGSISGTLQQTAAAAERVFEFLEEPEQEDESEKNATLKKVKGKVEFSHVNFGYKPEKQIIHDFNFTALPGQKIAIVGPTGAGKTTMVNLLMRFYEVNSGEIKIDGVSTKKMKRGYVRSLFGMVLQDTWLFEGTIKENIAYGNPNASDEEIIEACKMANVHHFIKTQPNGYDMVLNEDCSISAGQKQLLTIARAMVQNAPMLILDEATSSVDTRTEVLIQTAMDRLTQGRTSFVIAHRLSTIKNADQIIVMKDGSIVEVGNHKDLLAKKGFYADLYYSQFENGEDF